MLAHLSADDLQSCPAEIQCVMLSHLQSHHIAISSFTLLRLKLLQEAFLCLPSYCLYLISCTWSSAPRSTSDRALWGVLCAVALRLLLWLVSIVLLPTQKVYSGPGTSLHWIDRFGASLCPWNSASTMLFLISFAYAAASLLWMSGDAH